MADPRPLDLDTWPRREHYRFFRDYEQPFFNVCAPVDVTALVEHAAGAGRSAFFLASFYLSLRVANAIEPFRYRLRESGVVVHDVVHGGSTVLRDDGTFTFAYFDYAESFAAFRHAAEPVLEAARSGRGPLEPRSESDAMLHYSVLPWIAFTSFAHARRKQALDSVPKIVFGRHVEENGRHRMPVSVEVHHALMDGLEVGRYFEELERAFADPDALGGTAPPQRSSSVALRTRAQDK